MLSRKGLKLVARAGWARRGLARWAIIGATASLYLAAVAAHPWSPWGSSGALATWGYTITGLAALLPLALVPAFFASVFVREKETGTMESLLLTPLPRKTIVGARLRPVRGLLIYSLLLAPLLVLMPRDDQGIILKLMASSGGAVFLGVLAPIDRGWSMGGDVAVIPLLAGAAAFAGMLIRIWSMAWTTAALSLRSRSAIAALLWSYTVCAVPTLAGVGLAGLAFWAFQGAFTGLDFFSNLAAAGAFLEALAFLAAGLLFRWLLPRRFDAWAVR